MQSTVCWPNSKNIFQEMSTRRGAGNLFFFLRHFGHLYRSNIKTRRNTILYSLLLTELIFAVI